MKNIKLSGYFVIFCTVICLLTVGTIIGRSTLSYAGKNNTVYADKTDLKDMQYTFRAVAAEVLPSVVEINITQVNTQVMPEGYSWPFNFIEPEDDSSPETREYETQGLGSGVIVKEIDNKYYVLTNNHVIGDADKISVILNDKTEINAELIGTDERKDLALVSIQSDRKLPVIKIGNSEDLYVGDWVLAVGSPLGYESTVTAGIVSAIGRSGPDNNISDFIQTDASINQGNSGGALVNLDGELVGINTWIATTTGVSIGLGFSIPVNNVKSAIDDFIANGSVQYGWLGVSIADADAVTAEQLGISEINGALIYNIYEDSPAWKAGLLPGDFITKLNNTALNDYKHFIRVVGDLKDGDTISLEIIRNKKRLNIIAEIEMRKSKEVLITLTDKIWPGFIAVMLDSDTLRELGLSYGTAGVIVSVDTGTKAFESGLKDYDIITEINDIKINNILDFYSSINDKSNSYVLKIIRNNSEMRIELQR